MILIEDSVIENVSLSIVSEVASVQTVRTCEYSIGVCNFDYLYILHSMQSENRMEVISSTTASCPLMTQFRAFDWVSFCLSAGWRYYITTRDMNTYSNLRGILNSTFKWTDSKHSYMFMVVWVIPWILHEGDKIIHMKCTTAFFKSISCSYVHMYLLDE